MLTLIITPFTALSTTGSGFTGKLLFSHSTIFTCRETAHQKAKQTTTLETEEREGGKWGGGWIQNISEISVLIIFTVEETGSVSKSVML